MNISILCIGKLKEKFWQEAQREYEKRLRTYARISICEIKEAFDDDVKKEGESILKKIDDRQYVIALDIKGRRFSSEGLSDMLAEFGNRGDSNIAFVIGGSNGLCKKVLERANMSISFSDMTFTHQMIRVILLEQIYRGFKIMKGEPYHK